MKKFIIILVLIVCAYTVQACELPEECVENKYVLVQSIFIYDFCFFDSVFSIKWFDC